MGENERVQRSRSRRIYVLWGVALSLLLALRLLSWFVVAPCLQVRWALGELRSCSRAYKWNMLTGAAPVERALERLGGLEEAVPKIAFYLRLPRWATTARRDAVSLLADCGPPAVPVLARTLREEEPPLRTSAAAALGCIGPGASSALPALIESLDRAEIDLRNADKMKWEKLMLIESHTWAMSSIGPAAAPGLAKALGHRNPVVRACAATGLAGIGPKAKAAAPAVIRALADKEEIVRAEAVFAFNWLRLGPGAEQAVPALAGILGDSRPGVRRSAVWALRRIGPAARPVLEKALKDKEESVRQAAREALERIKVAVKGEK